MNHDDALALLQSIADSDPWRSVSWTSGDGYGYESTVCRYCDGESCHAGDCKWIAVCRAVGK